MSRNTHPFFISMQCDNSALPDAPLALACSGLNFSYEVDKDKLPPVLCNVTMRVERGSRVLLVGANGAGKSTLLRIFAGKHIVPRGSVHVMGKDAFHDMTLCGRVTYVGDRWTQTGDVKVSELIGLEGRNKKDDGLLERRMHLLNVLDVDPHWRIYRLSDGQRRRVQILMAMIQPADVLLLDEISTDLDVIGRQNLLNFLKDEAVVRGATVVYSTHIFDGIESWASHIAWVTEKTVKRYEMVESLPELQEQRARKVVAPLFNVVEGWLRKEWEDKKAKDGPVTWTARIDTYELPDKQYLSDLSRTFNVPTPLPMVHQQRTLGV